MMILQGKDIADIMDDADSSDGEQCNNYDSLIQEWTEITGMICAS